jgi:hypothetical protein
MALGLAPPNPPGPPPTSTFLALSPTTYTRAPSPTPCPQVCPSGKLRDICCVTETELFPGQSRPVGGGSIGARGGRA